MPAPSTGKDTGPLVVPTLLCEVATRYAARAPEPGVLAKS